MQRGYGLLFDRLSKSVGVMRRTLFIWIISGACASGIALPGEISNSPEQPSDTTVSMELRHVEVASPELRESALRHFHFLVQAFTADPPLSYEPSFLKEAATVIHGDDTTFPQRMHNFATGYHWKAVDRSGSFIEFRRTGELPWPDFASPVNLTQAPEKYPSGVFARLAFQVEDVAGQKHIVNFLLFDRDGTEGTTAPLMLYPHSTISSLPGSQLYLSPQSPIFQKMIRQKETGRTNRNPAWLTGLVGLALIGIGVAVFYQTKRKES